MNCSSSLSRINNNEKINKELIGKTILIPQFSYNRGILSDSERTCEVIDSFCFLGVNSPINKKIKTYDDFSFKVGNVNIIYGPSGSGKTTILNQLKSQLGGKTLVKLPNGKAAIIDLVGTDTKSAIDILTSVGLGEGNLFLRRCSQLSEGQKFRMRIAIQLSNSPKDILYVDEFGAHLDETTARVLARMFSSQIKKRNQIVFICCNNENVVDAFDADTIIKIGYDFNVNVTYPSYKKKKTKSNSIRLELGDISDYHKFRKYHYIHNDGRIDNIQVMLAINNGEIIGVNLLKSPLSNKRAKLHPFLELINNKIITTSRLIVHPEFRNCGIAKKLAIEAPLILGKEISEVRSSLFLYAPLPLTWGFSEYENPYFQNRIHYNILKKYIDTKGYRSSELVTREHCLKLIESNKKDTLSQYLRNYDDEMMKSHLGYLIWLMKENDYIFDGDKNELVRLFLSETASPKTNDDFIKMLLSFNLNKNYRSFYYNLKNYNK